MIYCAYHREEGLNLKSSSIMSMKLYDSMYIVGMCCRVRQLLRLGDPWFERAGFS